MQIFQLIPINSEENEKDWLSSTTKEPVIVRAESKERARKIVVCVTHIAIPKTSGYQISPFSPWNSDKLSSCNPYIGNEYNSEGEEEILSSIRLQEEWKKMNSIDKKIVEFEEKLTIQDPDIEIEKWNHAQEHLVLLASKNGTKRAVILEYEDVLDVNSNNVIQRILNIFED